MTTKQPTFTVPSDATSAQKHAFQQILLFQDYIAKQVAAASKATTTSQSTSTTTTVTTSNKQPLILQYNAAAVAAFTPVYEFSPGFVQATTDGASDQSGAFIGVTAAAATSGTVGVVVFGDAVNPIWAWTVGSPVYLNTDGTLTQVPPDVMYPLIVGDAISATTLFVNPRFYTVPQSLSMIPAGETVFIPSAYNLLAASSRGLTNNGTLVNYGSVVMVTA